MTFFVKKRNFIKKIYANLNKICYLCSRIVVKPYLCFTRGTGVPRYYECLATTRAANNNSGERLRTFR